MVSFEFERGRALAFFDGTVKDVDLELERRRLGGKLFGDHTAIFLGFPGDLDVIMEPLEVAEGIHAVAIIDLTVNARVARPTRQVHHGLLCLPRGGLGEGIPESLDRKSTPLNP